jgi:hypothetical protein
MKNLIKVVALSFVLLFGFTNISAQNLTQDQDRPEVVAKKIVNDLSSELNLNGDQQRAMFRAYTANETNYRKHIIGKDANDPTVIANKNKFDEVLTTSVKKILNDDQYKKWLSLKK